MEVGKVVESSSQGFRELYGESRFDGKRGARRQVVLRAALHSCEKQGIESKHKKTQNMLERPLTAV